MIILEMGWIPDYLKLNRTERDWFDANKKIIGTSNLLWIRLKLISRPFQSVSKISSFLTVVWSHSTVDLKFSNCSWVPPRDGNLVFLYAFGKTDAINRVVISDVYSMLCWWQFSDVCSILILLVIQILSLKYHRYTHRYSQQVVKIEVEIGVKIEKSEKFTSLTYSTRAILSFADSKIRSGNIQLIVGRALSRRLCSGGSITFLLAVEHMFSKPHESDLQRIHS